MTKPEDDTTKLTPSEVARVRDREVHAAGEVEIFDKAGKSVGRRALMPANNKGELVFDGKAYKLREGTLASFDEVGK